MVFSLFKKRSAEDRELLKALQPLLGFRPSDLELFKRAFRHKSVIKDTDRAHLKSNERLEFLGDAVLDTVVADYLYQYFPDKGEGFLTKMRAKIVSREYLNKTSVKLGVNRLVQSNLENGAEGTSINGNALEALIGAIYLDQGFQAAIHFIIKEVIGKDVDMKAVLAQESDYKSRLIEWSQKKRQSLGFKVKERNQNGDKDYVATVIVNGNEVGTGAGPSKKKAEQEAAASAWKQIFQD